MRIILFVIFLTSALNLYSEDRFIYSQKGGYKFGEMGNGTDSLVVSSNYPVQYGKDSNWVKVEYNEGKGLGIKEDGSIWRWNDNTKNLPIKIGLDNDWLDFIQTIKGNFAIKKDGTLWSWGSGNLGFGLEDDKVEEPKQIGNENDWEKVVSRFNNNRYYNTLLLKKDGSAWYFGSGFYGFHGYDSVNYFPKKLDFIDNCKDLYFYDKYFLAVKKDGTLMAYSKDGPINISTDTDWEGLFYCVYGVLAKKKDLTYRLIIAKTNITDENPKFEIFEYIRLFDISYKPIFLNEEMIQFVINGNNHSTYKIKSDSTLWVWGLNTNGILGLGHNFSIFDDEVEVEKNSKWKYLTNVFYSKYFAIKSDGTLWHWGGTNHSSEAAQVIGTDNDWLDFKSADNSCLAIKDDGTIWTWGDNRYGQLGLGDFKNRYIPTQIGTDNDWLKIDKNDNFNIAMKKDGTLWMWGIPNIDFNNEKEYSINEYNLFRNFPVRIDSVSPNYNFLLIRTPIATLDKSFVLYNENFNTIVYHFRYSSIKRQNSFKNGSTLEKKEHIGLNFKNIFRDEYSNSIYLIALDSKSNLGDLLFNNNDINVEPRFYNKFKINNVKQVNHTSRARIILKNDGTMWALGEFYGFNYFNPKSEGIIFNEPYLFEDTNEWSDVFIYNSFGLFFAIKKDGTKWEFSSDENGAYKRKVDDNDDYLELYHWRYSIRSLKNTKRFSVSGNISNNSIAMANIKVTCNNDTVITDSDGNYIFTGLIKGKYKVTPVNKCNSYNPEFKEIIVDTNLYNIDFDLEKLYDCYSISGIISKKDVKQNNIPININDTIVYTDNSGEYILEYLKEGKYTIIPVLDTLISDPTLYEINLKSDRNDLDFGLIDEEFYKSNEEIQVDVYPNPILDNQLNLTILVKEEKYVEISLIDIFGRTKLKIQSNWLESGKNEIKINLNEFAEGIYFISCKYDDKIELKKIMK